MPKDISQRKGDGNIKVFVWGEEGVLEGKGCELRKFSEFKKKEAV